MPHDVSLLDCVRSLLDFTEGKGLPEADAMLRGLLVDVARSLDGVAAPGGVERRWPHGPIVLRASDLARPQAGNLSEAPCPVDRREQGVVRLPF